MIMENTIREKNERIEEKTLSEYAALSVNTKGRKYFEEKDDMRTDYQRDRDRIIHSKSFRRLKHKTQVFLSPEGDHYRTRLTHTLEVSQIARSIARALDLNEDLTEAIALGHDLGHTPFGHAGERVLDKLSNLGFDHSRQSVRVVDVIEKDGLGLNLTYEVKNGIANHRTSGKPSTLEGKIVQFSDKIAYINHDIDDAIRAGIFREESIPKEMRDVLGNSSKTRIDTLIRAIVDESYKKPTISMKEEVHNVMKKLRDFMFENLYQNERAKSEEKKAEKMIEVLYLHFCKNIDEVPKVYLDIINKNEEKKERAVCDYIASMSDKYCVKVFEDIYLPSSWKF